MQRSDTLFSGSIPELYEREMVPLFFEPYAEDLVRRIGDLVEGRVLELAAGTGVVTRALLRALPPTVEIVASDVNQAMIDLGATIVRAPNVRWQQIDAMSLPFADGTFAVVVCQFGVMFFPDIAAAFHEAARVLAPGGRFVFNVWDRIEGKSVRQIVDATAAAAFPEDPQFIRRVPFGDCDVATIDGALRAAGFRSVDVATVEKVGRGSARNAALGLVQGAPLRNEIEARDPRRLGEITEAVANAIAARFGDGSIEIPMRAHVVVAHC